MTEPSWISIILTGAFASFLGFALTLAFRRLYHKCFTEYDRSAIFRLSFDTKEECTKLDYSNAAVIVGKMPFTEFAGIAKPDLDPRDVIGFVVGPPKYIDNPTRAFGVSGWEPGYFVYVVINWERSDEFRRYERQGYTIARTIITDDEGNPVRTPESRVLSIKTASKAGNGIVRTTNCPLRYQPFKRAGFEASDIQYRKVSWLALPIIHSIRLSCRWWEWRKQQYTIKYQEVSNAGI